MNLKNFDSVIFDLDGTLWDSTKQILEAWNEIIKRYPQMSRKELDLEELSSYMGLPMYEIAERMLPLETKEMQMAIMDEMCEFENEYLALHGGVLFEGLEGTLSELSKKYRLFIVSNCQDGYIEAFLKAHKLEKYFTDTECWGRTRLPKSESNKLLVERNDLKAPVYVGDTAGDAKAAALAGIPFIFAQYGFGNVSEENYIYKISRISELKSVL